MRICPSGHCLCHTIQEESIRIWNDLEDAQKFLSPIHEDTITQTLVLNLNRMHSGHSRVRISTRSEEARNGSDFVWLFFSPDLSKHIRLAVQAKRLYSSGKYEAFKANQANKIQNYAKSIQGTSAYVFYNHTPFLRAYNDKGGGNWYWHRFRYLLGSDCMRHFGSIYVRTEDILNLKGPNLSANEIVNVFCPLWHPFCICDEPKRRVSVLENFAERFNSGSNAAANNTPEILKTSKLARLWMSGERIDEVSIEELLELSEDRYSEGFAPSYILGTRLIDSDLKG